MNHGNIVFSQLMQHAPLRRFHTIVQRHRGNRKVRAIRCLDLFYSLAFAQITAKQSLRDIVASINAINNHWYRMGLRCKNISRSTLADAAANRPWQIFAEWAAVLISQAQELYRDNDINLGLDASVYAMDSTTIDLCLALFPWAPFRRRKAAIKLHTLMNLRGNIPEFILITDGKTHDVNAMDYIPIYPGAYYLFDRGYLDFARLFQVHLARGYFVIRAQVNQQVEVFQRFLAAPTKTVFSDDRVRLTGPASRLRYPDTLRMVRYYDNEYNRYLTFLCNDFDLPAETIAALYKSRWQIEMFFKWIKQHLHIKAFYGTTANAVRTQIWVAVAVYVLVAIIKKRLALDQSLYNLLRILNVCLLERRPLLDIFCPSKPVQETNYYNQLSLFDL